jgi:hypothetical protein
VHGTRQGPLIWQRTKEFEALTHASLSLESHASMHAASVHSHPERQLSHALHALENTAYCDGQFISSQE